jgi:hypothetical protein
MISAVASNVSFRCTPTTCSNWWGSKARLRCIPVAYTASQMAKGFYAMCKEHGLATQRKSSLGGSPHAWHAIFGV